MNVESKTYRQKAFTLAAVAASGDDVDVDVVFISRAIDGMIRRSTTCEISSSGRANWSRLVSSNDVE